LGFCIKALTGNFDNCGMDALSLGLVALGLRISRLLRFCDLAISVRSSLFSQTDKVTHVADKVVPGGFSLIFRRDYRW